jgi:hypothetical protein
MVTLPRLSSGRSPPSQLTSEHLTPRALNCFGEGVLALLQRWLLDLNESRRSVRAASNRFPEVLWGTQSWLFCPEGDCG